MDGHVREGVFGGANDQLRTWADKALVQVGRLLPGPDGSDDVSELVARLREAHGVCGLGNTRGVWIDQFCDVVFETSYNSILPDKRTRLRRSRRRHRTGGGRAASRARACLVSHLADALYNGSDLQEEPDAPAPRPCTHQDADLCRLRVERSSAVPGLPDRTGDVSGLVFGGRVEPCDDKRAVRGALEDLSRAVHKVAARLFRVEKVLRATAAQDEDDVPRLQEAFACDGYPRVGIARGLARLQENLEAERYSFARAVGYDSLFVTFLAALVKGFADRAKEMCRLLHFGRDDAWSVPGPACRQEECKRAATVRRARPVDRTASQRREPFPRAESSASEASSTAPPETSEAPPSAAPGTESAQASQQSAQASQQSAQSSPQSAGESWRSDGSLAQLVDAPLKGGDVRTRELEQPALGDGGSDTAQDMNDQSAKKMRSS